MQALYERVKEAVKTIRERCQRVPSVAIILGTGLGELVNDIEDDTIIPYDRIPNFPLSTVEWHTGKLHIGTLAGKDVVVMQGRFHYYEGYTMEQVTFPTRVMRALGAKTLIVSNVCGGLNPNFEICDLMLIEDHINLMGTTPLIGVNDERLGPRFPDLCEPYSKQLIRIAEEVALEEKIRVHRGVYVAVAGPNLETRAEYRFLRLIGADGVGMSTVPEVIVGVQAGFRILGVSVISDMCLPDALEPVNIDKIIDAGNRAQPKLITLTKGVLQRI